MQCEIAVESITLNPFSSTRTVFQFGVKYGLWIFLRVVVKHTVYSSRFQQDVALQLHTPQRGGGVRRHKRPSRASSQYHDPAFFEMSPRPPADVLLTHAVHLDRTHQPGIASDRFQAILQRQVH